LHLRGGFSSSWRRLIRIINHKDVPLVIESLLVRDLRRGSARLRRCPECQIPYLVTEQGRFDQGCPLCAHYRSLGLSSLKVRLMGA
jgi:hypothetical protein